jgi:hypothetical protein
MFKSLNIELTMSIGYGGGGGVLSQIAITKVQYLFTEFKTTLKGLSIETEMV